MSAAAIWGGCLVAIACRSPRMAGGAGSVGRLHEGWTVASILTLALNPTIDVASECDIVRPIHKIRTANESYEPGGGGVNVARVIVELGGDVELLCLAGGVTGALLDQLLGEIPIRRRMVPIAGNTRISLTVFERKTGNEFRFIPNGPKLSP